MKIKKKLYLGIIVLMLCIINFLLNRLESDQASASHELFIKKAPIVIYKLVEKVYGSKPSPKYIVYECKYLCGGWADRLKGKQFSILREMSMTKNLKYRTFCRFLKASCRRMRWHS